MILDWYILKNGANVNHANKDGRTALMEAVLNNDLYTVKSLLNTPAMTDANGSVKPINYADKDGNAALMLALGNVRFRYYNNQEHEICLNTQKIMEELVKYPGTNFHQKNKDGKTIVTLAEELQKRVSL